MSAAATTFPISAVPADERDAYVRAVSLGFGSTPDDATIAHYAARPSRERLAARAGDRIVGTTATLDMTLRLPHAAIVPCAGVTAVTVQPTHRRRGILSALMRQQIDGLHAGGDAWAALYASEAAIYGRYGFGVASRSRSYRIDGPWKRLAEPVAPADDIEWLDEAQARERVPALHRAVQRAVPGMLHEGDETWRWELGWDPPGSRAGASARQIVAIGDRAWAAYRTKQAWRGTVPDGTLRVEDCMASDAQALRQLWAFLLGIDLVEHVTAGLLPLDDPLPWWLAERHRLRVTEDEPCYVRLVDVGAALSQRGTAAAGAVVLDVRDAFCPWNQRCWLLEGDGAALRCAPTDAPADVTLDVRELASLSLGGASASELARAALVDEHHPGALRRLDALLAAERPPWNSFIF